MIIVKENTALVGISELRTNTEKVLQAMKEFTVMIEKRNNPVAILMPIEKYKRFQDILETLEDTALGYLAKDREKGKKRAKYIPLEKIEKQLGLK